MMKKVRCFRLFLCFFTAGGTNPDLYSIAIHRNILATKLSSPDYTNFDPESVIKGLNHFLAISLCLADW